LKAGHLSQYFTGVAAKRLSAVESDLFRSHQHEFNGVEGLKRIFGPAQGKQTFPARFIYLNDHDDEPVVSDGFLTWYDARENHPTRSEHRLYFPTTTVSDCTSEGDLLVIGRRPDGSILVVIAEDGSTIANQVQWLFGVSDLAHPGFSVREELETEQDRIAFASRLILENIGVVVEESRDETYLDTMLQKFGNGFPTTREFSSFARSTLRDIKAKDDQDAVIMAWMEREEILFRTLERHLIADRLVKGFGGDVDGFIQFSLSVQNRRKSRVGYALENHLQVIFDECGVRYSRAATTEQKSKPDFLFPGQAEYHDPAFSLLRLTMLGVKSSCKDRWRQVLAEADRINRKHLLTLETAISTSQTDEMQAKYLQLVLPRSLHSTYIPAQQSQLMDVAAFTALVLERQGSTK
jgi:hypothetical protein